MGTICVDDDTNMCFAVGPGGGGRGRLIKYYQRCFVLKYTETTEIRENRKQAETGASP